MHVPYLLYLLQKGSNIAHTAEPVGDKLVSKNGGVQARHWLEFGDGVKQLGGFY